VPPGAVYVFVSAGVVVDDGAGADGLDPLFPLAPDVPFDPAGVAAPVPGPRFGPRFDPPVVGTPGTVVPVVGWVGTDVVVECVGRVVDVALGSCVVDVGAAETSTRRLPVVPVIAAAIPAIPSTDTTATAAIATR
jgi:hypothetical protein